MSARRLAAVLALVDGKELTLDPASVRLVYVGEPITRDDGLTDAEGEVMDALCEAVNKFGALERQHPDEIRDFVDGIHRCQDSLALRVARRAFPKGWPSYAPDEGGEQHG